MITNDTQISEGLRALSAVRSVYPRAVLAGGYLRDAWFGRSQKDIDIFVPRGDVSLTGLRQAGLAADLMPGTGYGNMKDVDVIYNVAGFGLPVQVIVLSSDEPAQDRISEHDFDFCQIWHDGWGLRWSEAFAHMNAHEVTLTHCEDQREFNRSMRRWGRLRAKYPDFKLVIPPQFKQYVTNCGDPVGRPFCLSCGEPFQLGVNVFTRAGIKEVGISGFCEACFDRITAEPSHG